MVLDVRPITGAALALLMLFCAAPRVHAADSDKSRLTVGRYLYLQSARAPQVSPDGTQIVYTRLMVDKQADNFQSAVWIMGADGQHHRFLAKGSDPVWSPDSKSIAYLAEGQPKGTQVFVLHLAVPGPASQLTWGAEAPSNLRWSPDGRQIGFTMEVPSPEKWAVDLPAAPAGAKGGSGRVFTERLTYRRDTFGYTA